MMKSLLLLSGATGALGIRMVGDEVPSPLPVLNVSVEESDYSYSDAAQAAAAAGREQKLAALRSLESRSRSGLSNLLSGTESKISKSSFLGAPTLAESSISGETQKFIENKLQAECGSECVSVWTKMFDSHGRMSSSWGEALTKMMQGQAKATSAQLMQVSDTGKQISSFMSMKHKLFGKATAWNPVDTPCFDATSCKLMELLANRCDFARVSGMATYNAMNVGVHVLGIVMNVLCACLQEWLNPPNGARSVRPRGSSFACLGLGKSRPKPTLTWTA